MSSEIPLLSEKAKSSPLDRLIWISPEDAPDVWGDIAHYIQSANEYGGRKHALHDWLTRILIGQADLYINASKTCGAICEAIHFPRRRVYTIVLFGGDGGHDYSAYQKQWEEAARFHRCDALEVFGRAGWKPVMKDLGYDLAHWVWRKEL